MIVITFVVFASFSAVTMNTILYKIQRKEKQFSKNKTYLSYKMRKILVFSVTYLICSHLPRGSVQWTFFVCKLSSTVP